MWSCRTAAIGGQPQETGNPLPQRSRLQHQCLTGLTALSQRFCRKVDAAVYEGLLATLMELTLPRCQSDSPPSGDTTSLLLSRIPACGSHIPADKCD